MSADWTLYALLMGHSSAEIVDLWRRSGRTWQGILKQTRGLRQRVQAGSTHRATWRCGKKRENCGRAHVWQATVKQRTNMGSNCPLCSGHRVCFCQSLAAKRKDLLTQWDWKKNSLLDQWSLGPGSKRKAWSITGPHAEPCNACVSHKLIC